MAHLWTPQDLPADFKLGWYHFPDASTVTLDSNGKIASIENKFNNGSRPCATADAAKRHLLQKFNGYDTAFSDTTNYGGILMVNTTGLPVGNADLCMIFVQMPQDGVVGGYRGGNNFWIDNPFPDYRLRTDKGDFTGTGTSNNSTLHTLIVNRKSGTTSLRVDGMARGSQTPTTPYNTTLGTFGIKGADAAYYVQKGASLGAIVGKRAMTADEMYLTEKWYATFTGQPVQADNPYINGLPMVADAPSVGDNASQLQTSTSPTAIARSTVAPNVSTQTMAASQPVLSVRGMVAANDAVQVSVATSPDTNASGSVAPSIALQAQSATSPSLAARSVAIPANAIQGMEASAVSLSGVKSAVAANNGAQLHVASQPALSVSGALAVNGGSQGQQAASPALVAHAVAAADNVTQLGTATQPTLAWRGNVSVDSGVQPQTANSPTLALRGAANVDNAISANIANSPAIIYNASIAPSDGGQTSEASRPSLFSSSRNPPHPSRIVATTKNNRIVATPYRNRIAA